MDRCITEPTLAEEIQACLHMQFPITYLHSSGQAGKRASKVAKQPSCKIPNESVTGPGGGGSGGSRGPK